MGAPQRPIRNEARRACLEQNYGCIYAIYRVHAHPLRILRLLPEVGSSSTAVSRFKDELRAKWLISDLGETSFCVGIAIERDRLRRHLALSQTALIDKVVAQFRLQDAPAVSTPMDKGVTLSRRDHSPSADAARDAVAHLPYRTLIGCLMYLAIGTRPDIALAVQQLSQFLDSFGEAHWNAAKRVVRYLKGTRDLRLVLGGSSAHALTGYTDASYASCPDTRRSISGYCFTLGSGLITWSARKQATVASSTVEAEYVAASEAAKEAVWLRALLHHLDITLPDGTPLYSDNTGGIRLSHDPTFHSKVKHVDVRYHLIREYVESNQLTIPYVPSHANLADAFTKPLERKAFLKFRDIMGLRMFPREEESS